MHSYELGRWYDHVEEELMACRATVKRLVLHATRVTVIVALAASGVAAQDGSEGERDRGRDGDRHHDAYAIGLWGDLPYSDLQSTVGIPNLIADMNHQRLAFSVHDGDLKQGNGSPTCSDALYVDSRARFDALNAPAMFTPGDN